MQLIFIDAKPVIKTGTSKRPPADIVATARQRLTDAQAMIDSLGQAKAEAQRGLEQAVLRGDPQPFRAELANVEELVTDQLREIADARADIALVGQLLDHHRASQIALADADVITAFVKPFTDFLETHNVNS